MSNKSRETVADIVAQIRDVAYIQTVESTSSVLQLADRIEEAHKCEVARLLDDNARLMAVLKPVLGIVIPPDEDVDSYGGCECRWCCVGDTECWRGKGSIVIGAVREAQRIYNGGGESEVK